MPILNVKLCTARSAEISAKIAAALTDLTVEVLKKKRELTSVCIEYISPPEWFIAGAAMDSQSVRTFYLDIKITEGTNTKDQKAQYISRVFSAVEGIIGPLAPASYIVVHDVRGDSWGYEGQTQEFRYIEGRTL